MITGVSDPMISGCYHRINAETLMKRAVSAAEDLVRTHHIKPCADASWAPAGRSIRHKVTGWPRLEGRDPASGALTLRPRPGPTPCFSRPSQVANRSGLEREITLLRASFAPARRRPYRPFPRP